MTSEARVSANRRNAGKSTGPRTTQGKAVVAQNAIKHGLLARQNLIRGEDPQEFELCRRQLLGELEPVGHMETMLAERVVSLSWRIKRAERLQNEVFDYLMAREIEDSLEDFDESLSAEDEEELQSDPETDPNLAVGRAIMRDYSNERVLDRLGMYERRIESSLYRTMKELQNRRLLRKLDPADGGAGEKNPAPREPMTDFAKQSQSPAAEDGHSPPCHADPGDGGMDGETAAGGDVVAESAKQSQFPDDLPCKTSPIGGGRDDDTPAERDMVIGSAKQSQLPDAEIVSSLRSSQ